MRVDEIRRRLREVGVRPSKDLGQHFLVDDRVADRAVEYADPGSDESVLEFGPGLGVLTVPLAGAFDRVVAIEKDGHVADALADRLDELEIANVDVHVGDALQVDWPDVDVACANLPYGISSPLTFDLLKTDVGRAVLMYQKEFGERLCADPGDDAYGRLTVNATVRAERTYLETVPRSAYWPQPDVDGALVELDLRPPPFEIGDPQVFDTVVRAMFNHRRKTSRNAVRLHVDDLGGDDAVDAALADWGLGDRRPGKLTPEQIGDLARRLSG